MGFDKGELTSNWEIEAARTREEDRRDYERELAGIDIGREARFHGTEFVEERRQGRSGASGAQRSAQRDFTSRLQMLLATNPGYAALYNDTLGALGDAEKAADDALEKLEAALTKARRETQNMLERAAKLPGGRPVFKDKDGQVWDEHGEHISADQAASIQWRGDEPTREAFIEKQASADKIAEDINDIRRGRVDILGKFREEMSDTENPPTEGRLEEIDVEARKFQHSVESKLERHGLRERIAEPMPTPDTPVASASVAIPNLP